MKKKVALGLSGGVDSAVCLHLLKQQGYDVTAVFIQCWKKPGCRAHTDREDALNIALKYKIPFKVLDFTNQYKQKVLSYFLDQYKKGNTPNPDVMCNLEIKFGLFYKWAKQNQYDYVATGHYAGVTTIKKDIFTPIEKHLITSKDLKKDQTYFLHLMNNKQLDSIIFPLQNYKKDQVRKIAHDVKLSVANKKDSVGICFIGEFDLQKYLQKHLGTQPGNIIDTKGNIVGKHQGLWFHTIGQRKGLTIDYQLINKFHKNWNPQKPEALYVIDKQITQNQLVIGIEDQLFSNQFTIKDLYLIKSVYKKLLFNNKKIFVKIRHPSRLHACKISQENNTWTITTQKPVRALAHGQSAVLYYKYIDRYVCLGGGII